MSLLTQKKNMKEIAQLLSGDLGYIYGERESGPNGAKKRFLTKSAAFLRALGKDLGFTEMRVVTNPSGIACSGSVSLYGMWSDGNGVCFKLEELVHPFDLLYRSIRGINDCTGGPNQWLSLDIFKAADYGRLCQTLLKQREVRHGQQSGAA